MPNKFDLASSIRQHFSTYRKMYSVTIWIFISVTLFIRYFVNCLDTFGDESFYMATVVRFVKGDAMLIDDWAAAQTHGFLLYPFAKIWYNLTRTTDGIFLYFRIVWFSIKLIISIISWNIIKQKDGILPAFGILIFFVADPYNIGTLSYNAIVILCATLTIIIIYENKLNRIKLFLLGIIWGIAIIAQPYCILVPTVFFIVCFCKHLSHKNSNLYAFSNLLLIFLGLLTMGGLFIAFILSRASVQELLENIPYLFSTPEHNSSFPFFHILTTIRDFLTLYPIITFIYFILFLYTVLSSNRLTQGFLGFVSFFCGCYLILQKDQFLMNEIFIIFTWIGLIDLVQLKRAASEIYKLFRSYYLWSLIFAISVCLGSNTGIYTTSSILQTTGLISVMTLGKQIQLQNENSAKSDSSSYLLGTIGELLILLLVYGLRIAITWGDVIEPDDFRHVISNGPLKGTTMKSSLYQEYYSIYGNIQSMNLSSTDQLISFTSKPIIYLCSDAGFGTPEITFGEIGLDQYYDLLVDYISLHPEKKPTAFYYQGAINEIDYTQVFQWAGSQFDITVNESSIYGKK